MWAFLSRRLRMWLLLAIAVPALGWLLGRVADAIEARRGPSGFSQALHRVSGWANRRARGPMARRASRTERPAADPIGARDPGTPAR